MKFPIPFRRKHTWFEANVDAFADGALWGRDLERFEAHVAACDACATMLEQTRQLKSLVAALPEPALNRSFAIDHAMLSGATPETSPASGGTWTGAVRSMQGLAAAGIALFAVLVVVDVGGGTTATSPAGDHDSAPGEAGLASEEADRLDDDAGRFLDDGGQESADEGGTDDDDDSGGSPGGPVAPEPTPTPGVGAAGNDRPTPAPTTTTAPDETEPIVQDDDPGANTEDPVLPPSAGDLAGSDGSGAETTALYADEPEGGVTGLRIAQVLALGAAFVGVVGYAVVRRKTYAR